MNIVYRTTWTEYENGWGSRFDGITYALTLDQMKTEIKRQEDYGDYECFSRADEIQQYIVTDEFLSALNQYETGVMNVSREGEGILGRFIPADE